MTPFGTRLRDHFQRELAVLRADAGQFAQAHPSEADALLLGASGSSDPQVNLLLQSFAFLAGRLRSELESAKAAVPNALLQHLQPHLGSPLPCMMVAQVQVKPDGGKGAVLARGRQVLAPVVDAAGQKVMCRLRSTADTPLVPLRVAACALLQPEFFPPELMSSPAQSMLRLSLQRQADTATKDMGIGTLRLYLNRTQKHAHYVYELLTQHLVGVSVLEARTGAQPLKQPGATLRWLGFDADEAALPQRADAHPGQRLLQEYFAFPEKFMFFELGPLDLCAVELDFDIYLHCAMPVDLERRLSPTLLQLNCLPLVNLFSQRIDPQPLDQTQLEYRLHADVQGHEHSEIHSLEELVAVRQDGTLRPLRPYFEMESLIEVRQQACFYLLRHEPEQLGAVAGTELYLSFVDAEQRHTLPEGELLAGTALCTNRRLPERLRPGQALQLVGPGPVAGLTLVAPPSPHTTPPLAGAQPWALVSQLALGHLSLASGASALATLKRVLIGHLGPAGAQGLQQVDGLRALSCRPTTRHVVRDGRRTFVHGLYVVLSFEQLPFSDGSALLFASVLRHFLALQATVNTVVELEYQSMDNKGRGWSWPPLAGAQIVL